MNYVESFELFGVQAKQIPSITGSGAPTASTEGAMGCLYMNTVNGDLYKCIGVKNSVYSWKKLGDNNRLVVTLTEVEDEEGNYYWVSSHYSEEIEEYFENGYEIVIELEDYGDWYLPTYIETADVRFSKHYGKYVLSGGIYQDRVEIEHIHHVAKQDITTLEKNVGDISTALDSILDIQNELIGGDGV